MGDIQAYIPRHVQPPVILGKELQGFEAAWVSSHLGVMTERNYPVAEVRGIRDADAAVVVEEAVVFRSMDWREWMDDFCSSCGARATGHL